MKLNKHMERFDCEDGGTMYRENNGEFIRHSDHEEEVALLKQYINELVECGSEGLSGLKYDEFIDITEKFEYK